VTEIFAPETTPFGTVTTMLDAEVTLKVAVTLPMRTDETEPRFLPESEIEEFTSLTRETDMTRVGFAVSLELALNNAEYADPPEFVMTNKPSWLTEGDSRVIRVPFEFTFRT
jgi:hypothetical protein